MERRVTGNCHARCGAGEKSEGKPETYLSLLGVLPEFDKKLATFRKYRISSDIILQSLSQLEKIYEDNKGLIISNCSIIICLATNDYDDCEWFSNLLGQKTVNVRSHNIDTKGLVGGMSGGSIQNDAENLMRPEDIRTMSKDDCLVIISGQAPFKVKKFRATDHPRWDEMNAEHFEYRQLFNTTKAEQIAITAESLKKEPAPAKSNAAFRERANTFVHNHRQQTAEEVSRYACKDANLPARAEQFPVAKLPEEAQKRMIEGVKNGKYRVDEKKNELVLNTDADGNSSDTVADIFDSFF